MFNSNYESANWILRKKKFLTACFGAGKLHNNASEGLDYDPGFKLLIVREDPFQSWYCKHLAGEKQIPLSCEELLRRAAFWNRALSNAIEPEIVADVYQAGGEPTGS